MHYATENRAIHNASRDRPIVMMMKGPSLARCFAVTHLGRPKIGKMCNDLVHGRQVPRPCHRIPPQPRPVQKRKDGKRRGGYFRQVLSNRFSAFVWLSAIIFRHTELLCLIR